jgi:hypothetical protein
MATALTLYVNTDVSGGLGDGSTLANAYSSASTMIAGAAQNLVTGDKWLDTRLYATSGTAETSKVTVTGWTTDATRYMNFNCPDYPTNGKWKTSTYTLEVVDDHALDIRVGFFRMSGIQIKTSKSSANSKSCVFIYEPPAASADIRASSCILWATGQGYECWHSDGYATTVSLIESSILLGGGTDGYGWVHTTGTNTIRNCTLTDHDYYAINMTANGATGFAYNCCVFGNYDDFSIAAGGTVAYCASDDGDGTNAIAADGADWDNEFTDYTNKDFTPLNSGNIYHGCGTRYVTLDFAGNTFDATTPTCGAFEYVESGETTYDLTFDDTLNGSEIQKNPILFGMTNSDGLTGAETKNNYISALLSNLDSNTNSDSNNNVISFLNNNLDSEVNSDSEINNLIALLSNQDFLQLSDLQSFIANYNSVHTDIIQFSDAYSASANFTYDLTANDIIQLSDLSNILGEFGLIHSESLNISESNQSCVNFLLSHLDKVNKTDSYISNLYLSISNYDGLKQADIINNNINRLLSNNDTIKFTDLFTTLNTVYTYELTFSDSLFIYDYEEKEKVNKVWREDTRKILRSDL